LPITKETALAKYQTDLTAKMVREILDYDPKTGIFRWKIRKDRSKRWNTRYAGTVAGYPIKGHIRIQLFGKPGYYAHRLAWLLCYGEWPEEQIDHKDNDRGHNAIGNLRKATNGQNMQNRAGPQKNGTSGYLGVFFSKQAGKWQAQLVVNGVRHYFGRYNTAAEAAVARDAGARKLHGDFAKTNSGGHLVLRD